MSVMELDYQQGDVMDKVITLPGSKYLANRLLILAALSESATTLDNMPHNEDIDTSIKGLSLLGAHFNWHGNRLQCRGFNANQPFLTEQIHSSHSGSFSRFIMPVLALSDQTILIQGSEKMNSRPAGEGFDFRRE